MKVLGIIASLSDPASRARILQYIDPFSQNGVFLTPRFFSPLKNADPSPWSHKLKKLTGLNEWRSFDFVKTIGRTPLLFSQSGYDIIWQNRLLQSQHFFWETKLRKPVVFDFDDAIWLTEGQKQVERKIEMSTMIFPGNEYLADFANKYNKNVHIVPTTVDTRKLFPLHQAPENFTIGWIGTESNFQYLHMIYQPLKDFLSHNKECRLMIVSSHLPGFLKINKTQLVFKQWEAIKENQYINEFSVGIMPLADTEWTRGKCSYKLLQYLACGKPAIVSRVGLNNKILTQAEVGIGATTSDEWMNALSKLKNEPALVNLWGIQGRKLVEEDYSCNKWSNKIIEHMKTV